jgi:DNA-binding XRE family transcriptional regulator
MARGGCGPGLRSQCLDLAKEILRVDETADQSIRGVPSMEGNGSKAVQPNRVRELRENRLMTQAQLARKARVALRTIHSVEKGMACRMDTKRKILLALGMRFEDKDQVFPPLRMRSMDDLLRGF